jgi:TonB family protein
MKTYVDLQVDATGRVTDVVILKTSGSADYDERVQKYYRKWRLIPAISAEGVPTASHLRMAHSLRGMSVAEDWDKTTLTHTPDSDAPKSAPEPVDPRVFDEPGRVMRMHCKDFLWEYDLLRKTSGAAAPFGMEMMVQTSLLEALKRTGVATRADLDTLISKANKLLRDAGGSCKARPDDMFVEQALVPAVKAALGRQ